MRPDDIRRLLHTRPFQPFRIHLSDGKAFEVRHPELAMVGRSIVAIGVLSSDEDELVFDHLVQCALIHITRTEPIDSIASV